MCITYTCTYSVLQYVHVLCVIVAVFPLIGGTSPWSIPHLMTYLFYHRVTPRLEVLCYCTLYMCVLTLPCVLCTGGVLGLPVPSWSVQHSLSVQGSGGTGDPYTDCLDLGLCRLFYMHACVPRTILHPWLSTTTLCDVLENYVL